jgi:hypothetical protein
VFDGVVRPHAEPEATLGSCVWRTVVVGGGDLGAVVEADDRRSSGTAVEILCGSRTPSASVEKLHGDVFLGGHRQCGVLASSLLVCVWPTVGWSGVVNAPSAEHAAVG